MDKPFVVVSESEAQYITEPTPPLFQDGTWTRTPTKFITRLADMTPAAIKIFLVMLMHVRSSQFEKTKKAIVWPGYTTLSRHTGIKSHRTIAKAIKDLMDLGYIEKREFRFPPITHTGEINIQKCWVYTLAEIVDDHIYDPKAKAVRISQQIVNHTLNSEIG